MKKLLFLWLAYFSLDAAFANGTDFRLPVENYLRPAPNAAALLRYVDYPVSYATGIPEISIPIHTLKTRELELPVTISYHAAGNRIGELASDVGLGWSLNCGGVVTRIVKGLPDGSGTVIRHRDDVNGSYLKSLRSGLEDTYLDSYFYNFNGQSGEFICDPASFEITQITVTDNIIRAYRKPGNYLEVDYFTITTPDGVVWRFSEQEETQTSDYRIVSSWYLSSATSHNRTDSLTFTYAKEPDWSYSPPAIKVITLKPEITTDRVMGAVSRYSYCKRLESVTGKTGSIRFSYLPDRKDQGPLSRLTAISCYDNGGYLLLKAELDNDTYFSGPRLKLKGIEITGSGGETVDRRRFAYFNEDESVPLSCGKDLFGYYNGTSDPYDDRSYSFKYAKTFLLNRIEQLTGGFTRFEYEPNGIRTETMWQEPLDIHIGVRVAKIETCDASSQVLYTRAFDYPASVSTVDFSKINGSSYLSGHTLGGSVIDGYEFLTLAELVVNTNSVAPGVSVESAKIYHTRVEERQYGNTSDTLKTVYTFSSAPETWTFYDTRTYVPFLGGIWMAVVGGEFIPLEDLEGLFYVDYPIYGIMQSTNPFLRRIALAVKGYFIDVNWMYGHLLDKEIYLYEAGRYRLVEHEHRTYENTGIKEVSDGLYSNLMLTIYENGEAIYDDHIEHIYYFNTYRYTGRSLPLSTVVTKYFDSGNVVEKTEYTYPKRNDRIAYGLPQTETSYIGDEPVRMRKYEYPFDRTDAISSELTRRNAIGKPLKTEQIEKNITVAGLETVYAREGDIIRPRSEIMRFGGGIADRYDFHAYDTHGNPVCVSRNGVLPTVYIWGYEWTEPVAEIRNATYDDVLRLDTDGMLQRIGRRGDLPESSKEMEWLKSLQTRLPDSEVRLFTYRPQIGLQTVTDPSGRTTRYEYDPANRLRTVRDEEDRVMENYRYHYRNR